MEHAKGLLFGGDGEIKIGKAISDAPICAFIVAIVIVGGLWLIWIAATMEMPSKFERLQGNEGYVSPLTYDVDLHKVKSDR
jgi:hypothetical protein